MRGLGQMNAKDNLDTVMQTKLREHLKWSMLFFIFNYIIGELTEKEKNSSKTKDIAKEFFKNWKKHACDDLVKKDLETINTILNSPKHIFYSILQNSGETIESTELYQEKYNQTLKKIEEFYIQNTSDSKNNND
jgi:hypothetical protein